MKQRAGHAGTYLVAAELTLRGFVATVTSRNARAVDILAYEPKKRKAFAIQVKTNSEDSSWEVDFGVGGIHEIAAPDLFYVFVKLRKGQPHDFYIVPSEEVKKRAKGTQGKLEWVQVGENDRDWGVLK